jgi:hypothetical protein
LDLVENDVKYDGKVNNLAEDKPHEGDKVETVFLGQHVQLDSISWIGDSKRICERLFIIMIIHLNPLTDGVNSSQ